MGAIGYYIALPFIYFVSLLPFPVLYLVSDVLFMMVYGLIGYRKEVVLSNLRNSFPERSEKEIRGIAKAFYRWFCDLTLETLKTLTISKASLLQRVSFHGSEVLERYASEGRSVILVLGHFGNWELAGARYALLENVPRLYVIYHPLADPYFDGLLYRMRTRSGNRLYTMRETSKAMLRDKDLLTATAFISDQTPSPERAYWTTFLGQDTPVFLGPEVLARKLDQPVLYLSITRPRRGYYNVSVEVLVSAPGSTGDGEITEIHTKRLELDIRNNPELWLWTHRRWKHRRPL